MPENFKIEIDVPVKPHVKQYLLRNLFFRPPFELSTTCTIGKYLIELLEPKGKSKPPLRFAPENVIKINLMSNYNYLARPYLSFESSRRFNRFVEKKMKEDAYMFISIMGNYTGKEINDCIREFQIHYGLREEDFSFDRIKQDYFRHRKHLESRIRQGFQDSVLKMSLKNAS